jgi:hypothetical protein
MKSGGLFFGIKYSLTLLVILSVILIDTGNIFSEIISSIVNRAEAAVVTLEPNPNTTSVTHNQAGSSIVFVSDQVGYKFHRYGANPNNGHCVYRKTLDGGNTWGTQVAVDTQTDCSAIAVWYDKWTPGDTGDFIHIATYDTGADEMFYNRLDTASSDTLLLTTATSTMPGLVTSYAVGTNVISITKATDGEVFMNIDDSNGTFIRSCSSNCNLSTSWASVGTPPQGNANSWSSLVPLSSGNVMLINRSTTNQVRSSIWNGSVWSTFSIIDASAIMNTTYDVGMSATVDIDTGDIYLIYAADNNEFTIFDHDIRAQVYSGGAWLAKPNIITNDPSRGILQVALSRDLNNGDIYAVYTARTTIGTASTGNVYWRKSSDGMSTWDSEQGPLNVVSGDMYGIDMNMMNRERLYVTWFDNTTIVRDILGNTVADIGPNVEVSSLNSQVSEVLTSTSDLYVGGAFLIKALTNQSINTITISESGSINAQDNIKNVEIYYDLDTTAPYDCVSESYSGSETQFGVTVSGGFSGSDGVASFSPSPVPISAISSMCVYVIFDVQSGANDGDVIEISIANPETDVLTLSGLDAYPDYAVNISGGTTVVDPNLTQFGYHWRLDNGSEITASSATLGIESTPLSALQLNTPRRLRIGVANQGSTSTSPTDYHLEYGVAAPTCEDTSTWETVGPTGLWNMSPSSNITDGSNTTNITPANGGVTDLFGTTYLSSNGALRDENNITNSVALAIDNFFEAEFSVVASSSAIEGETYCFRLTNSGTPFNTYTTFPKVTISADVLVQTFGTQIATTSVLATNVYAGGGFSIKENSSTRNVTGISFAELGSINGATGIENLKLLYEYDTTAPYTCSDVSYNGSESQFGLTSASGFSGPGETVTFNDSVSVSTTNALCLYVVYDVSASVQNNETINIAMNSPAANVVVDGVASVGPSALIDISGETTALGAILTQTNYHWRNDDGSESGATSASSGTENTPVNDFLLNSEIRLRLGVTNTAAITSTPIRYRLEYAPKITTCDMATVWTDVDAALDGWDMYDSSFLNNSDDTTNIAIGSGGISDGIGTFVSNNDGVRDIESLSGTTTIQQDEYVDLEYSITSTDFTSYGTSYCFRVSANGTPLNSYNNYAEINTSVKRDFKIQRGSVQVSGTSTTLVSGVNYTPVASTSLAFVMITNANQTGAGNTAATTGQNADDVTAYISNPGNLATSFTISRPPAATSNTRVDWEIIEFIGKLGTDNEIRVRDVGALSFGSTALVATGTSVSSVSDDNKVVVFVTGSSNRNASRNFYAGLVTTSWDSVTNSPVITRGSNGASIIDVSYAVVEFVGANWNIQRSEHTYSASGVIETESITPVNSLARTFIHSQKRMGATTNVVHYGHEVWLSSIGAVSYQLESTANVAVGQTSVAWIIENTQTGEGAMNIQRSNGNTTGGTAPLTLSIVLPTAIDAMNNTSISATARAAGANTSYPRPQASFTITSTSTYQIWRSNTGSLLTYRVELIEWPVADLSIRQNYYRFYVDNGSLIPNDPWPIGVYDIGENSPITSADEPLGIGEKLRIRMTMRTSNATMPAGFVNFKLQYALRSTTCSAVSVDGWSDVGSAGSSAVWRGFTSTTTTSGTSLSGNPPTGGDLLISTANVAGSLVHEDTSVVNPHPAQDGDSLEYDWHLEQNGANPKSTYCFRAVKSDGTPLAGYNNYPQIRTAGYTPLITNWRWYNDQENETPTIPLGGEEVTPIDIANNDILALRVAVDEIRNARGDNIKFKVQFSEDVTFTNPIDVVATSSCGELSLWCYAEGAGIDNTYVSSVVLSNSDSCVAGVGDGCGTHNTIATSTSSHTHYAGMTQEYSFYIRHVAARVNAVYYFRLYDVTNETPVLYAFDSSYPSLLTEGPTLEFSIAGLPNGTTTAGVVTTATTTSSGIDFGYLTMDTESIAAHRLNVSTNASEGYQVLKFAKQQLMSSKGVAIPPVTATNILPGSWLTACGPLASGCFGYHTTDPTLRGGSTRFAASDTYAGLETNPAEVMYSSIPGDDTYDIVYRIKVNELQAAGDYETEIVYLAVPAY